MGDIKCATDNTFENCQTFIITRDTLGDIFYNSRLLGARIYTLEQIIKSTHKR